MNLAQPQHHPSDATLMCYAAGSLDPASSVIVDRHLKVCLVCNQTVQFAENVGAALILTLPHDDLPEGALEDALCRIEQPAPPREIKEQIDLDLRPTGMRRATLLFFNRYKVVKRYGEHKLTLACYGTHGMPMHKHQSLELLLVLDGRLSDGVEEYGPGEVLEVDPETEHVVYGVGRPCLCLVASTGRLVYRSLGSRLRQKIFGL